MTEAHVPLVCSFESRRAEEMSALITRHGGRPLIAPSMRELPITDNPAGIAGLNRILQDDVTHLILLTGVGTEALLDLAESQNLRTELMQKLHRTPLLIRGPKPAAVLKRLGLNYAVKAPEPNTSDDLIQAIQDAGIDLHGKTVAVQEYGQPNPDLYAALEDLGAETVPVPVYRWALPKDTEPLKQAIRLINAGDVDVLMFTSAQQVQHVLQIAEELQLAGDFRQQAGSRFVASIGPTCSEAIRSAGLPVSFEASPPKMGVLVRGTIEHFRAQANGA